MIKCIVLITRSEIIKSLKYNSPQMHFDFYIKIEQNRFSLEYDVSL